jgi:HAD superfamily hydrolase (TIGR01490 family)
MKEKSVIVAFDFDGTITTKDTLLAFICFAKGAPAFLVGFLLYSPLLIAYKLKLYPNWKIKQLLFSFFFKGMKLSDFNKLCDDFCSKSADIIRNQAINAIREHSERGDSLVIISASIENWVQPFADKLGIPVVICTKIEVDSNACLTGRLASDNCYGQEKIRRLLQLFPHRDDYYLVAYGDSKGDKNLLDFADKKFYRTLQ